MEIKGSLVDDHTRCIHYHSRLDIIAIRMKCCNEYYSCIECHNEIAGHLPSVWTIEEFDAKAIFCGICYNEMTIKEYLQSNHTCPFCNSNFNPGCSSHYHLYFGIDQNRID